MRDHSRAMEMSRRDILAFICPAVQTILPYLLAIILLLLLLLKCNRRVIKFRFRLNYAKLVSHCVAKVYRLLICR